MPDTFFGGADLQPLLNQVGVDVTVGTTTVKGMRDVEDVAGPIGDAATLYQKQVRVRVVTGALALTEGATITVEGVSFRVIAAHQVGDGAYTLVYCGKP